MTTDPPAPPIAATPAPAAPASPAAPSKAATTSRIQSFADTKPNEPAKPADQPAPAAEPAKTEPAKPATSPDTKTAEKPAIEPLKDGEFPDEKVATSMRAGELSRHYKKLRADFLALKESVSKQVVDPKEHPDYKKLSETLTQREQRMVEMDEELRFSKFEASTEYKEKYEAPYVEAYGNGRLKAAALKVVERRDPNTDEVVQPARQSTAEDFDRLMSMVDDDAAADFADKLYGNKAAAVLYHREKALEHNQTRIKALENYRKEGGQREAARNEQAKARQKEIATVFNSEKAAAVEKYPAWFKPEEGDTRGNELLQNGFEFADSAFSGTSKDENGATVKLAPQELAKRHAVVRNKAAGFDRLNHKHQTLQKQFKELQTKLAELQASDPSDGDASRREAAGGDDSTALKRMSKYVT